MELNIALIYGSVRSDRQGIKAVNFFLKKLQEQKIKSTLIDPMEMELPFLDKMYKEFPEGQAPVKMEAIAQVQNNFDEDGNALDSFYDNRSKRFLDEFIWYVEALKSARKKGIPY